MPAPLGPDSDAQHVEETEDVRACLRETLKKIRDKGASGRIDSNSRLFRIKAAIIRGDAC